MVWRGSWARQSLPSLHRWPGQSSASWARGGRQHTVLEGQTGGVSRAACSVPYRCATVGITKGRVKTGWPYFFFAENQLLCPDHALQCSPKYVPALWEALLTSQPFPFPEPRSDPVATWHLAENTLGVQVSFPGNSLSTPQGGGCSLRTRPAFSVLTALPSATSGKQRQGPWDTGHGTVARDAARPPCRSGAHGANCSSPASRLSLEMLRSLKV